MTAFTTRFQRSWAEFVGPGATRTNTTITLAASAPGSPAVRGPLAGPAPELV